MKLESSEARNRAIVAISSAPPVLGFRLRPAIDLSMPNLSGAVIVAPMLVSTAPGAIALQRIPDFAYWKPTFLVNPITACFDAVYAAPALEPHRPPIEALSLIHISEPTRR